MNFQNTFSDYSPILSDIELSTAPPNATEFADLHEQSSALLCGYGIARGDNIRYTVLSAAREHLPMGGKITLMRDISHNGNDFDKLEELGQFFIDSVLKPMRYKRYPLSICPSPASNADLEIHTLMEELGSSSGTRKLREVCLRRDDYRCVASGIMDGTSYVEGRIRPERNEQEECPTQCVYIIPFGLGHVDRNDAQDLEMKAAIWHALWRYFPSIQGIITPETINRPENAMILQGTIHEQFDKFRVSFEPSREHADTCAVRYFTDIHFTTVPQTIVLRSHEPTVPLPHHELLRVHFTVASILYVSGLGEQMNALLDDESWEDGPCAAANSDGSTDLAGLVEARLLIGL